MDEEDFDKNDRSGDEIDFGIEEGDGVAPTEYRHHPWMVQGHNFDCYVDKSNKNGIFTENGIDEGNEKNSEKVDDNENEYFSEGAFKIDDGQSDEYGWSDKASAQADY